MSKKEKYVQTNLFDVLEKLGEDVPACLTSMSNFKRKTYQDAFVVLVKSFLKSELTVDEYRSSLDNLLEQYRKDFIYGNET